MEIEREPRSGQGCQMPERGGGSASDGDKVRVRAGERGRGRTERGGWEDQTRRIKQREQSRQIITIAHSTHNDHNNPPRTGFMELI